MGFNANDLRHSEAHQIPKQSKHSMNGSEHQIILSRSFKIRMLVSRQLGPRTYCATTRNPPPPHNRHRFGANNSERVFGFLCQISRDRNSLLYRPNIRAAARSSRWPNPLCCLHLQW